MKPLGLFTKAIVMSSMLYVMIVSGDNDSIFLEAFRNLSSTIHEIPVDPLHNNYLYAGPSVVRLNLTSMAFDVLLGQVAQLDVDLKDPKVHARVVEIKKMLSEELKRLASEYTGIQIELIH